MPVTIGRPRPLRIVREVGSSVISGGVGAAPPIQTTPGQTSISLALEPTQDSVNPRLWTLPDPGTGQAWIQESARAYWQGQRLQSSLLVLSGTGNRTLTLDASVTIALGDFLEVEAVKGPA